MDRIQARRGTAAQWTAADPVLTAGEPGLELDTGKIKFGDGTTPWSGLDYVGDHAIGTGGSGYTDPRTLFRDDCAVAALPAGVASTGGLAFDATELYRTVTGVTTYTTPTFPLRGTPIVEIDVTQRTAYTAGAFRLRIKKQSTGATVAWLDFAPDSNIVAYNSANAAMGNINTGGTSAGFTDGAAVHAGLSVDRSGMCTATISAITGGAGTSNVNGQQAWCVQTHKWASGLAGLAAGDALFVELSQDKPGATARVTAVSRLTVSNGSRA
jgi:hypothetical protein